jgi:chromate transporter
LVGGTAFIVPGLVVILALAILFFSSSAPIWVIGAGAGAGAAVPFVAVRAGAGLIHASWAQAKDTHPGRWVAYGLAGLVATALIGPGLVLVLLGCGAAELLVRRPVRLSLNSLAILPVAAATGGLGALVWVAFKVGALSYGGGFVIIPLMQADAVNHYHWMTSSQFLNAVALGQVTPGPVVQTVAVVGYAAAGVGGALLAAMVAFTPSFSFILIGAERFDRLRRDARARAFLEGAGPAAIGAILGSAIPLSLALDEPWQFVLLALAGIVLLWRRWAIVVTLIAAGAVGAAIGLLGGPLPG